MRIQEPQYLKRSQNCVYHRQGWQISWSQSPGGRSPLTTCGFQANKTQLAWAPAFPSGQHLLEAVVSPALLISAQVSPTSICYFYNKILSFFCEPASLIVVLIMTSL